MYYKRPFAFLQKMAVVVFLSSVCSAHADISVIVLEKNKSKWTKEDVRIAYLGRSALRSELVEQAAGQASHAEFRDKFLQVGENQIKLQWSKKIFSGQRAPTVKSDDQAVYQYVKSAEDAIGYVSTGFFERSDRSKEGIVELFQIK